MPVDPAHRDASQASTKQRVRPKVLLVHGIWNTRLWLGPFAMRLRAQGFAPELFGYASVFGDPEREAQRLIERLRAHVARSADANDESMPLAGLVGHSLGGLVILEALRLAPELPIPSVVCLGSPLCGSRVAAALATRRDPLAHVLGGSAELLQRGCPPWTGSAKVGMIAGTQARGMGGWFADITQPSDGTVTVAETRLPGLADHCLVPASHSGLVLSAAAAEQTSAFLRNGRFHHH